MEEDQGLMEKRQAVLVGTSGGLQTRSPEPLQTARPRFERSQHQFCQWAILDLRFDALSAFIDRIH